MIFAPVDQFEKPAGLLAPRRSSRSDEPGSKIRD
jgi:hypothetical protein